MSRLKPLTAIAVAGSALVAAFAGTASAASGASQAAVQGQTRATQTQPHAASSVVNICNYRASQLCLTANGVGKQMTVETSNWANLTQIPDGKATYGGVTYSVYEFQDSHGHCVYANGADRVTVEKGRCTGRSYERWAFIYVSSSSGSFQPVELNNVGYNYYMWIKGLQAGRYAWIGPNYGHYYVWVLR